MGEYADDYFRREVMSKHGFDPGSMYGDDNPRVRHTCKKCGKHLKTEQALLDHMRDKHGELK